MYRLSDNYYLRKYYLEKNEAPTQTVMKKKMSESLANVYFKSMSEKHKVYAGLEPPLKGGGSDWYMPPEEQLAGRAILKPVQNKHYSKFNAEGIFKIAEKLKCERYQSMLTEIKNVIIQSEEDWKVKISDVIKTHYEERIKAEVTSNSQKLINGIHCFENLYVTSITKLEESISIAAYKEIERIREDTHQHMKQHLKNLLKGQFIQMQNKYHNILNKKKQKLKEDFLRKVENIRSDMAKQIHDSNYEKHLAIEKLRHFLQCQNMASQVYVALKEKEECEKELELSKNHHKKTLQGLEEKILMRDAVIKNKIEYQNKCIEFHKIWKRKLCHVVKRFQLFVEYCLKQLPQHAEFFLNIEKLMLLQISEALDRPNAESIILKPKEYFAPEPRPRPFYLFCDAGHKPDIDMKLCKKNVTSSSSLPVIVINKRCIYTACGNFKLFDNKISQYIENNGDDKTNDEYELMVPVKYTSLMQLLELKLESSLMQIIQQELPNTRDLPINCPYCKIPFCFCSNTHISVVDKLDKVKQQTVSSLLQQKTHRNMTKKTEMQLQREPKWESYSDFVATKKCKCAKTAKKELLTHLPSYMKKLSPYLPPEMPNYETCNVETLKILVNRANNQNNISTSRAQEERTPVTKDVSTQYSEQAFDLLCTCLSDSAVSSFLKLELNRNEFERDVQITHESASFLHETASVFAITNARYLRLLLDDDLDLQEMFKKTPCD